MTYRIVKCSVCGRHVYDHAEPGQVCGMQRKRHATEAVKTGPICAGRFVLLTAVAVTGDDE